jgi:hypothetical protein
LLLQFFQRFSVHSVQLRATRSHSHFFPPKANDVAELFGARFVPASEGEQSKRLAEAKIKNMVSGDPVEGEKKYQDSFTYYPEYKISAPVCEKPGDGTVRYMLAKMHAIGSRIHEVRHCFISRSP